MAVKQRVLGGVERARILLMKNNSTGCQEAVTALEQVKELCSQALPQSRAVFYKEFFDGLLQAIGELDKSSPGERQEILKLSKEIIQALSVHLRHEEKFKKEVFFLPYKTSMWDSLESVWKAADEDKENCLAYVMPIPYCDRNPDGTAREWHCEKDEFPKYVPTLDWQSVDLKAWHPDVIFYHNPYENCNRFYNNSIQILELASGIIPILEDAPKYQN